MNDEQKKLYEFHRQEIKKIMIDVITSKGISLSLFKNFMISVFVIAAVLLFVAASLTPWIVGAGLYRDWETDRKSTRLNSSHSAKSRMPSSA